MHKLVICYFLSLTMKFSSSAFVFHRSQSFADFLVLVVCDFFIKIYDRVIYVAPLHVVLFSDLWFGVFYFLYDFPRRPPRHTQIHMKHQEPHHRQRDHPRRTHRHNHNNRRIDRILPEHRHHRIDDQHHDRRHHTDQEKNEKSVIPFADTVVDERTVVVEDLHAVVAC